MLAWFVVVLVAEPVEVAPVAKPVRVVFVVAAVPIVPSYFSRFPAFQLVSEQKWARVPHRNVLSIHYRAERKKKKMHNNHVGDNK